MNRIKLNYNSHVTLRLLYPDMNFIDQATFNPITFISISCNYLLKLTAFAYIIFYLNSFIAHEILSARMINAKMPPKR